MGPALAGSVLAAVWMADPATAQTSYSDFDAEIVAGADGSFAVAETIDVDFATPRHGIFRELPEKYEYDDEHLRDTDVDVLSVTRDGAEEPYETLHAGEQDEVLRLKIGDPDLEIQGAHRYEVRYRVRGAFNAFAEHDELFWNVTGSSWESPFARARVTVRGPGIIRWTCYSGAVGATEPCLDHGSGTEAVVFSAEGVGSPRDMSVVIGFAPGSIDVGAPQLEEIWSPEKAFTPTPANAGAAVVTGAGLAALLVHLLRRGRDERGTGALHQAATGDLLPDPLDADPDEAPVQFRPPRGLKPAHLGLIDDERVDPVDVGATVVDLAVRGHLLIEDRRAPGDDDPDWVLTLRPGANPSDTLEPFEQRLIDGLQGEAEGAEVRLADLKGSFHSDFRAVADRLYDESLERGWFRRRPDRTRARYLAVGVVAAAAAVGLAILAAATERKFGLVAVPLGLFGLAVVAVYRKMPAKTARGRATLIAARGFKKFIETAEKPEMNYAVERGEFLQFLPYAVAFGAVPAWARATRGLDVATATAGWYVGPVFTDWGLFGSGFSSFASTVGTGLASVPAGSGSSGFSAGGSGGGFGGGGGGSW